MLRTPNLGSVYHRARTVEKGALPTMLDKNIKGRPRPKPAIVIRRREPVAVPSASQGLGGGRGWLQPPPFTLSVYITRTIEPPNRF